MKNIWNTVGKKMESLPVSASQEALVEADELIRIASKIVDLLTSEA